MSLDEKATEKHCLLVEDQRSTRVWLGNVVQEAFPDLNVVPCSSVKAARQHLQQWQVPQALRLALVDIGLPDGSGIDLIRQIAEQFRDAMVVVATIYDDDAHLFDAIAAGAKGYLLKDELPDILIDYLRRIENGEPPLSPSIAHRIMEHFRGPPKDVATKEAGTITSLTAREVEVLTLMARGLTVREAAARLELTANTVASYIKIIYHKCNISSRAEATLEAVRRNLI
jgi:DNA-binding NarL/FixJ family response regulator